MPKHIDWLLALLVLCLFILALLGTLPLVKADEVVDPPPPRYYGVELRTGDVYLTDALTHCNLGNIEIEVSSERVVLAGTIAPLQPFFVIEDRGMERTIKVLGASNGLFMVLYETYDDNVPPTEAFWVSLGECPAEINQEDWNDANN